MYWVDRDHWAAWGETNEINTAGRGGETLCPENGSEGSGIAGELVLEVVGYLLWISRNAGSAIEQPAAYSDSDPRIGLDMRSQSAELPPAEATTMSSPRFS